jgi:hypothetical protein
MTKESDYLTFRWWVELNKHMGYEKIFISNQSIENHASFHEIFNQNKDFLELSTLKCIPNLQDFRHVANFTYLKKFSDLIYGIGEYAVLKFELINVLILNECYLDNIDKYKYVTVVDVDETIIPRAVSNFHTIDQSNDFVSALQGQPSRKDVFNNVKCDRYDSSIAIEDKTLVEAYFIDLSKELEIKKPIALHFQHGFYIHNGVVEKVMASIKKTLFYHSKLGTNSLINYTLTATDSDSTKDNLTFSFTIKNKKDLRYAESLLKVYQNVIKPFIDEFDYSKIVGSEYNRFFYVGGVANEFAAGKTVHDTRSTFALFIHYVEHYLNMSVPERPVVDYDKSKYWLMHNYVPWQRGHSSHFRRSYGHLSRYYRETAIQDLQLDLNYLDCFFRPVVDKLRRSSL